MEFRKTTMLRIYTGEDVFLGDKPLYKAVLLKAMELGLEGATVSRGMAGFAAKKRGMGHGNSNFFSGVGNLPVIIEIVDDYENLYKLLPYLEEKAEHAFITIEECNYLVTDYLREKYNLGKKC